MYAIHERPEVYNINSSGEESVGERNDEHMWRSEDDLESEDEVKERPADMSWYSPYAGTFPPMEWQQQQQRPLSHHEQAGDQRERQQLQCQSSGRAQQEEVWSADDSDKCLLIESINVTSMRTNGQAVYARKAHFVGVQEHSVRTDAAEGFAAEAAKHGWQMKLGPPDPEHQRPTGGVGFLARSPLHGIPIRGVTKQYEDAVNVGRLGIYGMDLQATTLLVAVLYGWTGSIKGSAAAEKTDDLCKIMLEELRQHPRGPILIMGDLNAEIEDLPVMRDLLDSGAWTDIGADAHIWGQPRCETTCQVHAAARATRRDYMIANELLLPAIEAFRVHRSDEFPTHAPLQLRVATQKLGYWTRRLRKPENAADAIRDHIDEAVKGVEEGKATADARKAHMQRLHAMMEAEMSERQTRFEEAGRMKDASRMWDLITAVAEASFVKFLGLQGRDAMRMRGRSKVTITTQQDKCEPVVQKECTRRGQELKRNAGRHFAQANRLINVARRMKCARAAGVTEERKTANLQQNIDTVAAYLTQAAILEVIPSKRQKLDSSQGTDVGDSSSRVQQESTEGDADDQGSKVSEHCKRQLLDTRPDEPIHAAKILMLAEKHKQEAQRLSEAAKSEMQQQARLRHDDAKRGVKHISRTLDRAAAPPLRFVRRDSQCTDGGTEGSFTTDPRQIDGVVMRAWRKICEGNLAEMGRAVAVFLRTYRTCLFIRAEPFQVEPIDTEMVWRNFQAIVESAGGMDGWQPTELKLFSFKLCGWVAEVLRCIEEGAAWPTSTRHAKIAYLEKEGSVPGEVMSYRPLTIMAPIYRRWASMRLRSMEAWVDEWAMPEMHAGVAQQGAVDASYQVMAELEVLTLQGVPYCGGAADIFKFFDQIVRALVYQILALAGMPTQVLDAYRRFLEALITHNVVAGGVGHGQSRRCGIPQGCPLSMMVVAILMRPWIVRMRGLQLQVKVLADDVLLLARGTDMVRTFANALRDTHRYLIAMGAKVAPSKSFNFASCKLARDWLQETWWEEIGAFINVQMDFRYLGTHLSTQVVRRHTTLAARAQKALSQLHRLKYVAASPQSKAKAIRTKIYPGLFYGIEVNDLSERQLASISAAVIDVFAGRNDNHDADWFYATQSIGGDLDPTVQVLLRRALELRRCVCKRPQDEHMLKHIVQLYVEEAKRKHTPQEWYCGRAERSDEVHNDFPEPAPHPSKGQVATWKKESPCKGTRGPAHTGGEESRGAQLMSRFAYGGSESSR